MPLQNRAAPNGELFAVPERGTMMGNRGGKFHRDDQTLGTRRWASHHWICCDLDFKDRHHEPMGRGYTSLFFLDEVTALAAGHRPCFECRQAEAKAFLAGRKADEFDRQLHAERLERHSTLILRRFAVGEASKDGPDTVAHASRPHLREAPQHEVGWVDGMMVEWEDVAYAVRGDKMLRWSFSGYDAALPLAKPAKLLTPPSIIAILAKGYQPRWHPSAQQWDDI
jgi:hypothetical protein